LGALIGLSPLLQHLGFAFEWALELCEGQGRRGQLRRRGFTGEFVSEQLRAANAALAKERQPVRRIAAPWIAGAVREDRVERR
jgi:hypothetical protein